MARSSEAQWAQRVNAAQAMIREYGNLADAAAQLAKQYAISRRQAYRYLHEAQARAKPVSVPDRKVAFTVKLTEGLVQELRRRATVTGQSLSELVAQAVEAFLRKARRRGR